MAGAGGLGAGGCGAVGDDGAPKIRLSQRRIILAFSQDIDEADEGEAGGDDGFLVAGGKGDAATGGEEDKPAPGGVLAELVEEGVEEFHLSLRSLGLLAKNWSQAWDWEAVAGVWVLTRGV
jgi:hypothetical protein